MVNFGNIEVKGLYVGNAAAKRACLGGETVWGGEPPAPVELWQLCFTAEQANSTVAMTPAGNAPSLDLEYSTNGTTWSVFTPGSTTVTLANVGDKVWLRAGSSGNQAFATSSNDRNGFTLDGKLAASGDLMSLLDGRNRTTAITASNCFNGLFRGCASLTQAPALPATTLADSCYYGMFINCHLTQAPALPATTLAGSCYRSMFNGCTSLSTAPELPATTLASYCYSKMFEGCTSLKTPPPALPATTGQANAYNGMFQDCSSMAYAPRIHLSSLGSWQCYGMFGGCRSLSAAPELSAAALNSYCYAEMFNGCTSLKTPPPVLPATTLAGGCYFGMFRAGVPLTSFPALPATTLAGDCYMVMFNEDTSITKGPYLQAPVLASGCYQQLFDGATSLSELSVGFGDFSNGTTNWTKSVSADGAFYCPSRLGNQQTIARGTSACPNGWTVRNPTWIRYSDGNTSLNDVAGEIGRTDFEAILQRDGKTSADIYAVDFGQDVTSIAPSCFADWGALREVKIGDNVQAIGDNAFRRRQQLSSVQWGSGSNLTAIGPYAFAGVQKVGQYDIPDGVLSIGNNAFVFGSVLSVVTLPQSVTSVGGSCFSNNSALLSVVFHGKTMADVEAMTGYPWGATGKVFVD